MSSIDSHTCSAFGLHVREWSFQLLPISFPSDESRFATAILSRLPSVTQVLLCISRETTNRDTNATNCLTEDHKGSELHVAAAGLSLNTALWQATRRKPRPMSPQLRSAASQRGSSIENAGGTPRLGTGRGTIPR